MNGNTPTYKNPTFVFIMIPTQTFLDKTVLFCDFFLYFIQNNFEYWTLGLSHLTANDGTKV